MMKADALGNSVKCMLGPLLTDVFTNKSEI